MVGVPGKSKGCATCRRRKIRVSISPYRSSHEALCSCETQCDLQEPACRKCTQSGRECEGYARYPIFLNRTVEGPQKRRGLEEAKIPIRARSNIPPTAEQGEPSSSSMLSSFSFLRDV